MLNLIAVAASIGFPSVARLTELVDSKDLSALSAYLTPMPAGSRNPFSVIKTGGAYVVGKYPWKVFELPSVDSGSSYVVLSTPLSAEDAGEILFERIGDRLRYLSEEETMGVRIRRHSFDIRFLPSQKKAEISDKIELLATPGRARFMFRMSPAFRVLAVRDGNGEPVTFSQAGGIVLMRRSPHRSFEYRVFYEAVVDLPAYAGYIQSDEAMLSDDCWYPTIGRNPASYDATVHAPKGWTVVAQGERVSTQDKAQETVTKYDMELPVSYFSLCAGKYRTVSDFIDGRRIWVRSMNLSEDQMHIQTALYAPILRFYEQFAPYPFTEYGAVQSADFGGDALEAYSFCTWGPGLPQEDAHEPAHTWWGGILNNTYLRSFWNESFAVFSEGLYRRNVPIGNRSERAQAFASDGSAEDSYEAAPINGADANLGPEAGSLGYGKGAKVLGMLEQLIGTPAMIRLLREWIAVHPKGEAADWPEFVGVAERLYPQKHLDSFFRDWLDRAGYARFSVDVRYDRNATAILLQWHKQRYRMPLRVMLEDGSGGRRYVILDNSGGDLLRVPGPKPRLVSIDPFGEALRPTDADVQAVGISQTNLRKVVDPAHADWLKDYRGHGAAAVNLSDPDGLFIVGSPETLPVMGPLCRSVGFQVHGNHLTYHGTTIDLEHGSAIAIVELGQGKRCMIGLGKIRVEPNPGKARLVLTDEYGRFLRGVTEPRTSGPLTYRLEP